MKPANLIIAIPAALILILIASSLCLYSVQETEQAIITQFGKPVGDPITSAGLHLKLPFVQNVNRLDRRVMEWDSSPEQIPTADKLFIKVDTYARWRIKEPLVFFQSLTKEDLAQSRLDDILDGETRNSVAKHRLNELVRTDKKRTPPVDPSMTSSTTPLELNWQPISLGRDDIAHEIFENARKKLDSLGIELIDIRFKRIMYNTDVQSKIFERMISERQQIAEKFRSEGQGQAAQIAGEKARELNRIESEAYRKIQEIKGKADADATDIYAKAYNQSPEASQFYLFQKTMDTYLTTMDKTSTLILSTGGEFYKYLNAADGGAAAPASTPAPAAKPSGAPAPAPPKPTPPAFTSFSTSSTLNR